MINFKDLIKNPHDMIKKLQGRGFFLNYNEISALNLKRKKIQIETEELQHKHKVNSRLKNINKSKIESIKIKNMIDTNKKNLKIIKYELNKILSTIPNIPHESTPNGTDSINNIEIYKYGKKKIFDFTPKEHFELGENLINSMNFNLSAKLSGSKFVVLNAHLARLHRAIGQFMINFHTENNNYQEVYVPHLIKKECLYNTGQLPKFENDQFSINNSNLWLIPTGEVPLVNIVSNTTINEKNLPIKYASITSCFRKEIGHYGKDTKGMLRQHQFEKIELVHIVKKEDSYKSLEELKSNVELIMKKLELPYRVLSLCKGEMGFSSSKTYDIEVWMPGQNKYREISSCSNTEDFQSRRMKAKIKYKNKTNTDNEYLHILNGSGVAVGRALMAIMENNQDKNGFIHVPRVLVPLMGGIDIIK